MRLEEKVARLLKEKKKTISIAESCTGGLLSHMLTNIPGSTKYFQFGIVAYSNQSKGKFLKIPQEFFLKYGAVSKPVSVFMARNVRKIHRSDFGIGITGIAGPTGGSLKKPVGLVYITVCSDQKEICEKHIFKGNRLQIKSKSAKQALRILLNFLE